MGRRHGPDARVSPVTNLTVFPDATTLGSPEAGPRPHALRGRLGKAPGGVGKAAAGAGSRGEAALAAREQDPRLSGSGSLSPEGGAAAQGALAS